MPFINFFFKLSNLLKIPQHVNFLFEKKKFDCITKNVYSLLTSTVLRVDIFLIHEKTIKKITKLYFYPISFLQFTFF